MKTRLLPVLALSLVLACAAGCGRRGPVRLHGDFLKREHAAIGVALGPSSLPGVRDSAGGYAYAVPRVFPGPGYDEWGDYSDQGRESESGAVHGDVRAKPLSSRQGALIALKGQLEDACRDAPREAARGFARGIEKPGWRVVPLDIAIGKVDPDAPYLEGLDAIVILDLGWHGALCRGEGPAGDRADAGVDLSGRMIDLSTGRLLWRSPKIKIRHPVPCGCVDPGCGAVLARGVNGAVDEAREALLRDFSPQAP
jgi:hypothetical protein